MVVADQLAIFLQEQVTKWQLSLRVPTERSKLSDHNVAFIYGDDNSNRIY